MMQAWGENESAGDPNLMQALQATHEVKAMTMLMRLVNSQQQKL